MMLSQLSFGDSGRVTCIRGGHRVQGNLNQLGIHVGDIVSLSSRGAFHGPYLVQVHGMQVALGRGIVAHIEIDPLASSKEGDSSHLGGRHHHRRFGRHASSRRKDVKHE